MLNTIELQGRLARDPEIKTVKTANGDIKVARITVCWSQKYKQNETKCFLDCTAWRGSADTLEKYFVKGKEIIIRGHMVSDQWKAEDGTVKTKLKCQIDEIHFCGSKGDDKPKAEVADSGFIDVPDGIDEELPFN